MGPATHKYVLKMTEGQWPSDRDLINMCDGYSYNFGGRVQKTSETSASVHVYVD